MGLFDKLLGKSAEPSPTPFSGATVKSALEDLVTALDGLVRQMDSNEGRRSNPGWSGRLRDLRGASADLSFLIRRTDFDRDAVFEVLTTVRPLFKGTPAAGFEDLEAANKSVELTLAEAYRVLN